MALAVLLAGCADAMRQRDRLRIERVENAVLPMATAALETGQMETAKRLYGRLLEVDPESFRARMGLGETALRERQAADAARWYAQAIEVAQAPAQRHEALLAHGRAALESGQLQAAQESFARLASPEEQAPQASAAWGMNGVGLTQLLQDDLPAAVESMERAVLWAPSEPMFRENLARARAMLAERGPFPDEEAPAPATSYAIEPGASAPEPDAAPEPDDASLELVFSPPLVEEIPPPPAPEARVAPSAADEPADALASEALPEAADTLAEMPAEGAEDPLVPEDTAETSEEQDAPSAEDESAEDAPAESASEAAPPRDPRGFLVHEGGQQFVQMGAYRIRDSAFSLAARLREMTDEQVFVLEGSLHRVRIGPLASQSALDILSDALDAAGFGRPRMVPSAGGGSAGQDGEAAATATSANPPSIPLGIRPLMVSDEEGRFMQFGAFQSHAKAQALALRLQELIAVPVFIMETQLDSGALLHRVRAGPIESDATQRDLADAAQSLGFDAAEG